MKIQISQVPRGVFVDGGTGELIITSPSSEGDFVATMTAAATGTTPLDLCVFSIYFLHQYAGSIWAVFLLFCLHIIVRPGRSAA